METVVENYKIKTLDQKMGEFKKHYDSFYVYLHDMSFDHRLLESEREMIMAQLKKLETEKAEAESKVKHALEAADTILAKAKDEAAKINANNVILAASSESRYKTLQEMFDHAEKKAIKQHLSEMSKAV